MYQQIVNPQNKSEDYLDPETIKAVFAANGKRAGQKLLEKYGTAHFAEMGKKGAASKWRQEKNKKRIKIV